MDNNATVDFRNPSLLRKTGMSALQKELGTVGTAYFMRQFNVGKGDYTTEREELLAGITLDDIIKNVRATDRKNH
jgi:hypothetical protein